MKLYVFDMDGGATSGWRKLADQQQLDARFYTNLGLVESLPHSAHVVVIDESVLEQPFPATINRLLMKNPYRQIVATSDSLRVDDVVDLMRCKAAFVLQKPLDFSRLASIWQEMQARHQRLVRELEECQRMHQLFSALTSREKDVLHCLLAGTSNREAAAQLGVSVRTIESRRAKVYQKLQARHVAEVVRHCDRMERLSRKCTAAQSATLCPPSEASSDPQRAATPGIDHLPAGSTSGSRGTPSTWSEAS